MLSAKDQQPIAGRISKDEIISLIVSLLKPYADPDCPHLKEPRFKAKPYKRTGVIVNDNHKGRPNKIEFSFFMEDVEREKFLYLGFLFDIETFHAAPKPYIMNMLNNFGISMAEYSKWRSENKEGGLILLH